MNNKGKAPTKDKGEAPLSFESQNLVDQLWSAIISCKRKQTRKSLSLLCNHLKFLEDQVQYFNKF